MAAPLLWFGLAAAAGLFVISKTEKGSAVLAAGIDTALRPRGIRNRNPGNIDWIEDPAKRWRGMIRKETPAEGGRFGVFDTDANGVRAIGRELLLDETRGLRTVKRLINSWAPPVENDTSSYVKAVAAALKIDDDLVIDVHGYLPRLAEAIIRHENAGQCPYTQEQLQRWVYS